MTNFKFELGIRVKDVITGFEGTIVSRTDWLTNCNTYGLQPDMKNDKIPDRVFFDEPQLEVVNIEPIELNIPIKKARETGGPTDTPQKTTNT